MTKHDKKDKHKHKSSHKLKHSHKHSHKSKKDKKDKINDDSSNDSSSVSSENSTNQLTRDDYFIKSEEFRVYLQLIQNISFESLTSEEAKDLFEKYFVKDYNQGKLPEMYYSGIPLEIREAALKSKHRWNINLSRKEKEQVSELSDKVDSMTRLNKKDFWNSSVNTINNSSTNNYPLNFEHKNHSSIVLEREHNREVVNNQRKQDRYRMNELIEDVAPKEIKGSFQSRLDSKRTIADNIHGASRDRESNRDGLDLPDSVIFGGSDENEFKRLKTKIDHNNEMKRQMKDAKIRMLAEKESQKQAEFLTKLGIDFSKGEKIVIAPR